MDKNVAVDDIGIISPYFAQVKAIKKDLHQKKKEWKKIACGTVEEFQGEEKKIILISAVKTAGLPTALKFIFCPKRLNTAISRARLVEKKYFRQLVTGLCNEILLFFSFLVCC